MVYKSSIYNVIEKHDGVEYLINTLSQSIVKLLPNEASRIKELLKKPVPTDCKEKKYIDVLLRNDFLVPINKNELAWLKYLYTKKWFDTTHQNIVFLPTLKCNFSCPYCFEMEKSLDIDEARLELFIKYLRNITKTIDVLNISFFGGEPLIKIHEIEHILEELLRLSTIRDCKVYTHITTKCIFIEQ